MSKRSVLYCVLVGMLLFVAAALSQKSATPPPEVKQLTQVASAPPAAATTAAKPAEAPKATGFPSTGESLTYSLNWPGGASLGEAHLSAGKTSKGWQFDFSLDASIPGFALADRYHSEANSDFCSLEFEKHTAHGQRRTNEKTVFDYKAGSATRTTLVEGGGHTDISIGSCAHDGLDFVYYARRQLAEGKGVPQEEDVLFGASYSARMQFAGVQEVTVGGKRRQADHIMLYVKGPASDYKLELFFERNPARTPLIIKAPLPVGTLTMELVR